jgi:hypothetical protein
MTTESSTKTSSQKQTNSSRGLTIFMSIMVLTLVAGGWQMAVDYVKNITAGNMQEDYTAIANQDTPTFILFRDKLAEEGITPDISEMSVFSMTEAAYKYKWQRGDDSRVYVIRRNASGLWDTYLQ